MNAAYLGDSFDLVKRFLVATLKPLGDWSIHPMLTKDRRPPGAAHFRASDFAALVGAPFVSDRFMEDGTRESFVESCKSAQHLLLDPDTGICKRNARPSVRHVSPEEVENIVMARPGFITAVYDQSFSRGPDPGGRLRGKLKMFSDSGIHGFAYDSHARFLFLSASGTTLEAARLLLLGAGLPEFRVL